MIAAGILDLADVVQERGELGALPVAGVELERLRDLHGQRDDVAAVAAGVGVVRLDDVAEQECRAAIRMAQLDGVVDAHAPFPGKNRKQAEERDDEQEGGGMARRAERNGEPDRRERRVHEVDPAERLEQSTRRDADAELQPDAVRDEVERPLGAECRRIDGCAREPRRPVGEQRQDEHRPDGVPGADADGEEHPLDVHLAGSDVDEVRERDPGGHAERCSAERDEEEQRNEHELRRDRRPGSDLELDAERDGIGADEQRGRQPAKARAREQKRQGSRDDEERPAHQHRRPAITVADP